MLKDAKRGGQLPVAEVESSATHPALASAVNATAAASQEKGRVLTPQPTELEPARRSPADPSSLTPLSFAQQRLWFLEQLHPGSPLYNIPVAVRLRGPLDPSALQQALAAVVERHEVLRSRFLSLDGEPWQQVFAAPALALPLVDLSARDERERESQLQGWLEQEARRPFDLAAEVLLRAALVRLAPQEHVLFLNLHHIASDAFSYEVLCRELSRRYGALVSGVPVQLPDLPIQYADYAAWQRQDPGPEATQTHLAYWKEQLAGAPDFLELPTDRPRPAVASFRGERRARLLAEPVTSRLRQLSRREGVTLFMLLQAAFHLLLHRLTGQGDLLVGMPISGRHLVETEPLIGLFVNTLAIRSRLSGNPSFREFLQQVRTRTLEGFEHQELPFEKLVEELRPERSAHYAPLLQVLCVLHTLAPEALALPGLSGTLLEVHTGTAKFDLTLTLTQTSRGLTADMEYNSDLFEAETIERWLGYYERLLSGIATAPEHGVRALSLMEEPERRRLLVEWNQTRREYPRDQCIHELFEEQVRVRPDAVALVFGEQQLTYRQLSVRANQVAHYLKQAGVQPGTLVGLYVERSLELLVGLLGTLKAGGAYAALDLASPRERLGQILAELQAPVVLTQSRLLERLPVDNGRPARATASVLLCLDAEREALSRESEEAPASEVRPESLAYVSFTSGSTGRPKGVCVPHRAVVRLVRGTDYARFSPNEVFLHLAPVAFDASTFEIWGCLLNGGRLVVAPPDIPSLSELAETLQKHQVTTAWFTSGLFNQLVDVQLEGLRPLRQILTGGDVLSPPHIKTALSGLGHCRLINGYGPTENTTFSTAYTIPPGFDGQRSVPIGRPIANSQCYVLDEELQPVPIGIPGELYVGGDGLALGYLNQPKLTAERFIAHPFEPGARLYKTGDRARYLADGNLEFLGRLDLQVKVRGFRVELGEVEARLLEHPAIQQCAVAVRPDAAGTKQLVAYVISRHTPAPAGAEVREFVQRTLPDYMVPQFVRFLDALPLSPNGKVDRQRLPALERGAAAVSDPTEPRDELERQLQQLWENTLNVRPIGVRDKFFALGGHSLLAMRLLARVERSFGKKLTVAALFQNPTIEQMAVRLREGATPGAGSSLVEIQGHGNQPPLMLVHGAGGGMFWGYNNLARHLGPDQPVFGFRSRGLDGQPELESVEEMAEAYLADLRGFQPQGPYYLGGFCFGGLVAYEMACRLQAQGEPVAVLALINSTPPNSGYSRFRWTPGSLFRFARNLCLRTAYSVRSHPAALAGFFQWKAQSLVKRLAAVKAADGARSPRSFDEWIDLADYPEDQRQVWQTHLAAVMKYQPRPYPGRVVLLRSPVHLLFCSFDPQYGWGDLCRGGVSLRIVPGAHETIMEEPRVQALAAALRQCLSQALAGPGTAQATDLALQNSAVK